MKKVLSLAIAAALVAPAAVMADATLFGKAHFIIENVDDGDQDVWGVDSIHSRVGVKGSEDLGGGLKALYHFEFKVHNDDGADGLGDRNQFIGLSGGFGTALLGTHDTPMKMSQGKFDEFGDLPNGDLANVIPGDDRLENVIAYVSP
ncbi:MAG: porin, partial [Candidatus Thiodiazotropha endolucinida]